MSTPPEKPAWANFDDLIIEELVREDFDVLRGYAVNALGMTGASRIPGGKMALLVVIDRERRKRCK
jgi:hypothetical protein